MELITLAMFLLFVFLIIFVIKKVLKIVLIIGLMFLVLFSVLGYIIYQDYQNFKYIFEEGDINFVFYDEEVVLFGFNIDFPETISEELGLNKNIDYELLKGYSDLLLLIEIDSLESIFPDMINFNETYIEKQEAISLLKGKGDFPRGDLFFAALNNSFTFEDFVDLYKSKDLEIYEEPLSLKIINFFS